LSTGEQLAGALLHADFVDPPGPGQLPAEEEVRDDVEVVAERQILVDRGDPERRGVRRFVNGDRPPLPPDLAGVGGADTGDHLDQRGLSGAVVADKADKRDDLAGIHLQAGVGQGLHRAESLRDARQSEHR
jgi:hypothetical protein